MTPERKAIFLEHLSKFGIVGHAAKHATPHAKDKRSCRKVFYDERERDPQFAIDWEQALDDAEDIVIEEMRRRGVDGVTDDVYGNLGPGEGTGKVGKKQVYSDRMLELYSRVKSQRVRQALTNKVELSGKVEHEVGIEKLSPEKQALLEQLLSDDEAE